jgi:hypothetical protein
VTHDEFLHAYREGTLQVNVDRAAAARLVSARLMLPFVLLPVLGLAVALALTGHLITGIAIFVAALALRFAIRRSSHGFVLSRSLQDPAFFDEMVARGIVSLTRRDEKNGVRP